MFLPKSNRAVRSYQKLCQQLARTSLTKSPHFLLRKALSRCLSSRGLHVLLSYKSLPFKPNTLTSYLLLFKLKDENLCSVCRRLDFFFCFTITKFVWLLSIPCSWVRMLLPTPVPQSLFEILKEMEHGTHITISAHPEMKAQLHGRY